MKAIAIFQDSRGPGTCRSCGAPIEWAETVARGARMPFDVPVVIARTEPVLEGVGRVVEWVDMDQSRSHFATCPDGPGWPRRRAARKGAPA